MKRKSVLVFLCLFCLFWTPVRAQQTASPVVEELEDQPTPESAVRPFRFSTIVVLLIITGMTVLLVMMERRDQSRLYVSQVENNGDGTMTVTCVYHSGKSAQRLHASHVRIRKGAAIIMENEKNRSLDESGQLKAVIDAQTELEIEAGGQTLIVSQKELQRNSLL